jgi:hypothetical protein
MLQYDAMRKKFLQEARKGMQKFLGLQDLLRRERLTNVLGIFIETSPKRVGLRPDLNAEHCRLHSQVY